MNLLKDQEDFHLRYMQRRIEELNEIRRNGKRTMRVRLEEVERIMLENYSLHIAIRQMSQRISDMSMSTFMVQPLIWPKKVGGE